MAAKAVNQFQTLESNWQRPAQMPIQVTIALEYLKQYFTVLRAEVREPSRKRSFADLNDVGLKDTEIDPYSCMDI